jgi:hypothetical protein
MMDGSLQSGNDTQNTGKPSGCEGLRPFKRLAAESKRAYLTHSEGDKLRRLIEGTVASMTAEKLSTRYDRGLEHDRLYEKALAEFRFLLLDPRTRVASLRAFLEHELPLGRPYYVKVLFLETIARLLGRAWVSDECDFIDVTIGTARLQEMATCLSMELRETPRGSDVPNALILTPFGEQHTLMPHLIGLLFDSLGWASQVLEPAAARSPVLVPALEAADVVCIGWSNVRLATEFKTLVQDVRELRRGGPAAPGCRWRCCTGFH